MTIFAVDTRDLFTVHQQGCPHLRIATAQNAIFEIDSEPNRAAILEQLVEFDQGDGVEDVIAFGPCLRGVK